MAFSDNFIKRPVLTTVCSILIVLMGVIAIPTLPIANLPNIAPPLISVTATYGGANSLVTEQAVTNPPCYTLDLSTPTLHIESYYQKCPRQSEKACPLKIYF